MRNKSEKCQPAGSANKAESDTRCHGGAAATNSEHAENASPEGDVSYKPEYARLAKKICKLGGTEADVVEALNASIETIEKWRKDHKDFSQACKQGREIANSEVQRSVFKMAVGYNLVVEEARFHQGRLTTIKYRKYVQPNSAAANIWLLNRYPEKWNSEPEPEEKESELARLYNEICGSRIRPNYEGGTPVPYSILRGDAKECDKEVEIEKEKK